MLRLKSVHWTWNSGSCSSLTEVHRQPLSFLSALSGAGLPPGRARDERARVHTRAFSPFVSSAAVWMRTQIIMWCMPERCMLLAPPQACYSLLYRSHPY